METFAEATPRLAKVLCIQTVRANDLEELAKKPAEPCPACPPPKVIRKNDVWELLMVGGLVGVVVGSVALGIGLALSSGGK